MSIATAVIDTADILLAQPIAVRPGETIDFSGTALSVDFAPISGGGVVMSASTEDGTLAFVGGETPYFRIDLPVAGRAWRIARPTAVRGDILRRPDPAHPAQVEWLGRVDLLVQPGSNSSAIALKAQAPILLDRQPYDGRIVTAPMVVGPQGAIDRSYTDEQVVALKGGADTDHDTLRKLGDLISGLSIAGVQGLAQALAGKATPGDIAAAVNALLSGAGPAYDTLKELQDLIINDETAITALSALVALKASKADLAAHATDLANPHGVTKAQIGLANVANLAPLDLPVSTAQATAIATAIANLVASSPAALDTLNELATALGNDPNFAATIMSALAQKADQNDSRIVGALQSDGQGNVSAMSVVVPGGLARALSSVLADSRNVLNILPQVDATTDFTATINGVIGAGKKALLPYTGTPYKITNSLVFAARGNLTCEPGVVLQWAGPSNKRILDVPVSAPYVTIEGGFIEGGNIGSILGIIVADHFTWKNGGANQAGTLFLTSSTCTFANVRDNRFTNGFGTAVAVQNGASRNTVTGNEFQNHVGFGVWSTLGAYGNTISFNWTDDNGIELIGVTFDSFENTVTFNRAVGTGDNGISITGYRNRVIGNIAKGNAFTGIYIYGNFNVVEGNTALNNGQCHVSTFKYYHPEFAGINYPGINISGQYGGGGQLNIVGGNFCDDDQTTPTQAYGVSLGVGYGSWASATAYPAGQYIYSAGNIYRITAAGTSGATAPTHASGTVSDGGVSWAYISTLPIATREPSGNTLNPNTIWRFGIAAFNDATINKNNTIYLENRIALSSSLRGTAASTLAGGGFLTKVGTNWANGAAYTYGQLVYTSAGNNLYRVVNAGGTASQQPTHSSGTVTTSDGIAWLILGTTAFPTNNPQIDLNPQYVGFSVPLRVPVMETAAGYATIFAGQGSPEGKVTAPPGSLYLNQSGAATTTLWIKVTGSGNTGWIAK